MTAKIKIIRTPENLLTAKDEIKIRKEIYGDHPSTPLPPLQQVVPDRFYHRREYSRLWCRECGRYIGNGKSVNHYYCGPCADIVNKRNPVQKPNWKEENKREYRAMVLCGGHMSSGVY